MISSAKLVSWRIFSTAQRGVGRWVVDEFMMNRLPLECNEVVVNFVSHAGAWISAAMEASLVPEPKVSHSLSHDTGNVLKCAAPSGGLELYSMRAR